MPLRDKFDLLNLQTNLKVSFTHVSLQMKQSAKARWFADDGGSAQGEKTETDEEANMQNQDRSHRQVRMCRIKARAEKYWITIGISNVQHHSNEL